MVQIAVAHQIQAIFLIIVIDFSSNSFQIKEFSILNSQIEMCKWFSHSMHKEKIKIIIQLLTPSSHIISDTEQQKNV